jgi:metal-responsive CopG/Arc/MetJ family transcriptional regulator
MRTTITMPEDLLTFLDKEREKTCHSRSSYIAMLIKKHRGVTQPHTKQKKTKSSK